MVTLKTCLKLRSLGFNVCKWNKVGAFRPFYDREGNCIINGYPENMDLSEINGEVGVPTLDQLLEETKQMLTLERQEDGRWLAFSREEDEHGNNYEVVANSPSESVAQLWISINEYSL